MSVYYNEIDPEKAEWIRQLIAAKVVTPGDVDERDIKLVQPDDLRGYRQCHFFAGIAVWSYALRLAGWPDDREVWTGSCPCPSFSSAGKGQGFDDARHLWPDWIRLIRERKPATVFGEQVAQAIGHGWLDLVQTDMEAQAYAVGKIVLGSCSVGGSDIRKRLYFVAHTEHTERWPLMQHREDGRDGSNAGRSQAHSQPGTCSEVRGVGNTRSGGRAGRGINHDSKPETSRRDAPKRSNDRDGIETSGITGDLVQPERTGLERHIGDERDGNQSGWIGAEQAGPTTTSGSLGGFWANAEWIWCRDQKYRPVEPGTFPLAHGATARVLKLRGYGDAINAQVAKAFIEAYLNS